ncbi:MAG: LamG domain-containing protein [Prevotellaceae bacterium]|jgi:hypothetical protein|nr:LamG domain-containing protein [Prevotellaceae bacterium]
MQLNYSMRSNPIVKGSAYGDDGFKIEHYDDGTGIKWVFAYGNSTSMIVYALPFSPNPDEAGRWYDIEIFYTPEERGAGVDGNFAVAPNDQSFEDYTTQAPYHLLIGAPVADKTRAFKGLISDVRVYKMS